MMHSLALVIPCKNEARRLLVGEFLHALTEHPYLTLLFVDDGSTDDTAEILAFLERQSPSIRALYLPRNVGKAEAVRRGMLWLLEHTDSETLGFWDADLSTPFSELDGFIRALEADPARAAAIGARWPHLGSRIDRRVASNCAGMMMKALIRLVLRAPVYDTQCGAKVFRRGLAEKVFSRPFLSRWLFDVEILRRIPRPQLMHCVTEVPLALWRDVGGSKLGLLDTFRLIPDIMRIAAA